MTAAEYRAMVKHLGLRRCDVAWMMGVTVRQTIRWYSGASPVPRSVALLLKALAYKRVTPIWFRRHIDEPVPYSETGMN